MKLKFVVELDYTHIKKINIKAKNKLHMELMNDIFGLLETSDIIKTRKITVKRVGR